MAAKRTEITTYVTEHRDELLNGTRKLLFLDECFLLWGDACGYAWGKRNIPHVVPMGNPQLRQPYYGAIDAYTGQMTVVPYDVADQESTTDFLVYLQWMYPGVKLTICWDNAAWHKGQRVRAYLTKKNGALPPDAWPITCLCFAPHDPAQNPIEEVWRQAKTALRANPHTDDTFAHFTARFVGLVDGQTFLFPKLHLYGDLQMI